MATHSIYVTQTTCAKLTFRYNYSHHTLEGHLLKSRAKENWTLYNRLTDEDGLGSTVVDLPNGGLAVVLGNVLHKGPNGHNNRMIAFGAEGLKHDRNELYVASNSMWWDNKHPEDMAFVMVMAKAGPAKSPASQPEAKTVKAMIQNNVCVGPLPLTNFAKAEAAGNLLFKTPAEAGFVNPAKFDFSLRLDSPCIDKAVAPGKVDTFRSSPTCNTSTRATSRTAPTTANWMSGPSSSRAPSHDGELVGVDRLIAIQREAGRRQIGQFACPQCGLRAEARFPGVLHHLASQADSQPRPPATSLRTSRRRRGSDRCGRCGC